MLTTGRFVDFICDKAHAECCLENGNQTVLVVDDDKDHVALVAEILLAEGYIVETAFNVSAARMANHEN